MAALQCEICGGKLIGKPGGVFECDSCGMEYSTEWAKAKVQEIKGTVRIEGPVEVTGTVKVEGGGPSTEALFKRAQLAREDKNWNEAKDLYNQIVAVDPENAEAYLGLLLTELNCSSDSELEEVYRLRRQKPDTERLDRFAGPELKARLARLEQERLNYCEEQRKYYVKQMAPLWKPLREASLLVKRLSKFVGLKADGTVMAAGFSNNDDCCKVKDWQDIIAVVGILNSFENRSNIVGLKANGTVVAVGNNRYGQCDVTGWADIVAVAAGEHHTVGLRADGTVVAVGENILFGQCNVSGWRDIVAVSAGGGHTVGLRADGTVVATGENENGQCDVSDWQNIIAVSAGFFCTVGLKSNGTVVATGKEIEYVSSWTDVVALFEDFGLKADGTVLGHLGPRSGDDLIVPDYGSGLKIDGTITYYDSDLNPKEAKLFNGPNELRKMLEYQVKSRENIRRRFAERKAAEEEQARRAEAERQRKAAEAEAERQRQEAERQAKIAALEVQKQSVQAEIANCRGLFSSGKRRELEARLAQIRAELATLSGAAAATTSNDTFVKSPMPGNVFRVKCVPGQTVKADDVLVVLEAMKMEIEISAPVGGTVKDVNARVGAAVTTDDLLVTLS